MDLDWMKLTTTYTQSHGRRQQLPDDGVATDDVLNSHCSALPLQVNSNRRLDRYPMLGVIGLNTGLVFNSFVMLHELGREAIGQIGWYMIEHSRP